MVVGPMQAAASNRKIGDLDTPPPNTVANWLIQEHRKRVGSSTDLKDFEPREPIPLPSGQEKDARNFICARPGLGVKFQRNFGNTGSSTEETSCDKEDTPTEAPAKKAKTANKAANKAANRRNPNVGLNKDTFSLGLFATEDIPASENDDKNTFLCFFTGVNAFESRLDHMTHSMKVLKRAIDDYSIAVRPPIVSNQMCGPSPNPNLDSNSYREKLVVIPRMVLDVKDVDQNAKSVKGGKEAFVQLNSDDPHSCCSVAFLANGANSMEDPRINCIVDDVIVQSKTARGLFCHRYAIVLRRKPGKCIAKNDELIFHYGRSMNSNRSGARAPKAGTSIKQRSQHSILQCETFQMKELGNLMVNEWLAYYQEFNTDPLGVPLLPVQLCVSPPLNFCQTIDNAGNLRHEINIITDGFQIKDYIPYSVPLITKEANGLPDVTYWLLMNKLFTFSHQDVQTMYDTVNSYAMPVFELLGNLKQLSHDQQRDIWIRARCHITIISNQHDLVFKGYEPDEDLLQHCKQYLQTTEGAATSSDAAASSESAQQTEITEDEIDELDLIDLDELEALVNEHA